MAGRRNVEIDMGGVRFMDSSGIARLIGVHKRLTGDDKSLVLTRLTPHLVKVFEITGLERYFEFG
jgi:anti-sigma B factor antagonist